MNRILKLSLALLAGAVTQIRAADPPDAGHHRGRRVRVAEHVPAALRTGAGNVGESGNSVAEWRSGECGGCRRGPTGGDSRRLGDYSDGKLAERGGFEPPVEVSPYDGLANRCFRPLSHLSARYRVVVLSRC